VEVCSKKGYPLIRQTILLSVIRDISERKRAQQRIFESQAKYRSLFMNLHNGYAYFNIISDDKGSPKDLKFIEINEMFERMFNTTKK